MRQMYRIVFRIEGLTFKSEPVVWEDIPKTLKTCFQIPNAVGVEIEEI